MSLWPLGKLGPAGVMGDTSIVEAIEDDAPGRTLIPPHKGLEALVDPSVGDDVHRLQQVQQGGAVGGVMVERLLEQAQLA